MSETWDLLSYSNDQSHRSIQPSEHGFDGVEVLDAVRGWVNSYIFRVRLCVPIERGAMKMGSCGIVSSDVLLSE